MGDPMRRSSPVSSPSFSRPRPELNPLVIDPELWLMAEHRIFEILCSIQPALASEKKRQDVMSYVIRLIKAHYKTEVFAFGSVPLKTYLPDGDIDLTILSHQHMEDELAKGVLSILTSHVHDPNFDIENVQYIDAQVTVLKCMVNNISVDISFNQLSGLSALCFLEQADQIVGKDHLLKLSIILIKSWCYYESRILGAYHGLISAYALEILVLHIINLFHSSLGSPLAVLLKFLDYYSSFDWENCGISVNGVILNSSLPNIVAKPPAHDEGPLLLGPGFLGYCKETYAVPVKALDRGMQKISVKPMNIVDPLKENNNLGRSVNQGNFRRIKCALSYGARKLREILSGPGEYVGRGLEKFFVNTLGRISRGQRPDADVPVPPFGTGRYEVSDLDSDHVMWCHSGLLQGQWYHHYSLPDHFHQLLSLPPQTLSRGSRDVVPGFLRHRQTVLQHRGTRAFLQRGVSMLCPCPAKWCPVESESPSGTGTFIPDKAVYDVISKSRRQYQGQQYRPAGMTNQADGRDSPDPVNIMNSKIDLGPENFPSLPCTGNPSTFTTYQLYNPGYVWPHTNNRSTSSMGASFKTSSDSSSATSELTPLVDGNQVDSLVPSCLESSVTPADEKTAELEKVDVPGKRVAKGKEKVEECLLKSEDFPPLTKLR